MTIMFLMCNVNKVYVKTACSILWHTSRLKKNDNTMYREYGMTTYFDRYHTIAGKWRQNMTEGKIWRLCKKSKRRIMKDLKCYKGKMKERTHVLMTKFGSWFWYFLKLFFSWTLFFSIPNK